MKVKSNMWPQRQGYYYNSTYLPTVYQFFLLPFLSLLGFHRHVTGTVQYISYYRNNKCYVVPYCIVLWDFYLKVYCAEKDEIPTSRESSPFDIK